MRSLLLGLLLVAFLAPLYSQGQAREFRYAYGGSQEELGRSIAAYGRKTFFVWGRSNSNTGSSRFNAILIGTDSTGKLKTYKEYGTVGANQEGYSMKIVDTTLYLMGSTTGGTNTYKIFLIKARLDGTPIWQKFYETGAFGTLPFSMNRAANGDWVIATINNSTLSEIYRLDAEGNMLWRRQITGMGTSQITCVVPTADGGIGISGQVGDRDAYMAKLDGQGNVLWQLRFGQGNLNVAKAFVELPNGDFFINGYINRGTRDVLLARVSSTGQLLWHKYYDRSGLGDVNYGAYLDRDGNVIVTGYTYNEANVGVSIDYVIGKFDGQGNLIWGKVLSGDNNDYVDNGPDHLLSIGPDEYICMGSSASTAGGTQGQDLVLFRFKQATSEGCFNEGYFLTPAAVSGTVSSSNPDQLLPAAPVLQEATVDFRVTDQGICKRISCRPEVMIWDSLGPDQGSCQSGAVSFPQTLDAGNLSSTYLWNTGQTTQTIQVSQPGTYSVLVTATCGTFRDTIVIRQLPTPTRPTIVASGPLAFCEGGQVRLQAQGLGTGNAVRWSNGSTADTVVISASGRFSVLVTNPASGCQAASDTVEVTVRPTPAVPALVPQGPTTFCQGGSVQLRISGLQATDTVAVNGGPRITGQTSINYAVDTSGTFRAEVTNAFGCRAVSAPVTVTVNPLPPKPVVQGPPSPIRLCPGDSAVLAVPADVTGVVLWSIGTGSQSIIVRESGAYSYRVTNPQNCSNYSDTVQVLVYPVPPVPAIFPLVPPVLCKGDTTELTVTNAGRGDTVLWNTGLRGAVLPVSFDGTYSAIIIDSNRCRSAASERRVIVHPTPVPNRVRLDVTGPTCTGNVIGLGLDSLPHPGEHVLWSNGDTVRAYTYPPAGSYSATITNAFGCFVRTDTVTVFPRPPVAVIVPSGPLTFCQPGRVRLQATNITAPDTWRWINGPADSNSFWVDTSGTFQIEVTTIHGCTTLTEATRVTVLPRPTIRIDSLGPLTFCQPARVGLQAHVGNVPSYTLRWSAGGSGGTQDTVIQVGQSGLYVAEAESQGCRARDSLRVTANPLPPRPALTASAPERLCYGEQLLITATNLAPGLHLRWTRGQRDSVTIHADTTFGYAVQVTDTNGCRTTSDTMHVHFYDPTLPTLIVAASNAIPCTGDSVVLLADGPDPIRWNTGYVGRRIVAYGSGTYVAQAGGVNTCLLPVSDSARVRINPRPVLDAGPHLDACEGDTLRLGAAPAEPGVRYRWSTQDDTAYAAEARPLLAGVAPYAPADAPATLYLTLRADYPATGCGSVDTTSLFVHSRYELRADGLPYCAPAALLVPNVVTPGSGTENATFAIKILSFYRESTLEVYNRHGGKVYSASPYRNDWSAEGLPAGVYYYRLQVPLPGWDRKGWVEVVK